MTDKELIDLVEEFKNRLGDGYVVAYCARNVILHKWNFSVRYFDAFFFDLEKKCVYYTLLEPASATKKLTEFMEEKGLYDFWDKNSEWKIAMHPGTSFL